MAFTKLVIKELPILLCGPLLRRVEPKSVTVWVALKESKNVTLTIKDAKNNVLFQHTASTIPFGTYLHIIAVTAKSSSSGIYLKWGAEYFYDLSLNDQAIDLSDLGVRGHTRPSFRLPPSDIKELRILHGSCRKPHGEGPDALLAAASIVGDSKEPRPHMLLMTGDQIYADDVADALLYMIRDAGKTLMDWEEAFPLPSGVAEFPGPGERAELCRLIGISAEPAFCKSHLLTLQEYIGMYLFIWSPVLWDACKELPTVSDVYGTPQTPEQQSTYESEAPSLITFRAGLDKIRRLLANIPVYMIFDDHDVTDDWDINLRWHYNVHGNNGGERFVTNALIAYTLFQAWGNAPEQFASETTGDALLTEISTHCSTKDGHRDALSTITGTLFGDDVKLRVPWHFTLCGPGFLMLVTDTRTRRGFDTAHPLAFPQQLTDDALDEQVVDPLKDASPGDLIILVLSTNLLSARVHERAALIATPTEGDPFADAGDPWEAQGRGFERLLDRLAAGGNSSHPRKVVILSGDVHYAFVSKLSYWKLTKPDSGTTGINLESLRPSASPDLVIAQLTSSSLKNQDIKTKLLHSAGFLLSKTQDWLGWRPPMASVTVTIPATEKALEIVLTLAARGEGTDPVMLLLPPETEDSSFKTSCAPDWCYRMEWIASDVTEARPALPAGMDDPPVLALNKYDPSKLNDQLTFARDYRDWVRLRRVGTEIVGVNNLGDVSIQTTPSDTGIVIVSVMQRVWWWNRAYSGTSVDSLTFAVYTSGKVEF